MPGLAGWDYTLIGDIDFTYNCVAWAAGEDDRIWWPNSAYWPPGVATTNVVASFVDAFRTLGYLPCADDSHDPGLDKIAIFTDNAAPTHVARQLSATCWSSKMGHAWHRICHPLGALRQAYGDVAVFLQRPAVNDIVRITGCAAHTP